MRSTDPGPPHPSKRLSMAEQHAYLRETVPTRRGVLRRGAVVAGAAVGAGTLLTRPAGAVVPAGPTLLDRPATGVARGVAVAPFGRHLAFGADPRTQVRVSWQVPVAVRRPFARIGLRPWELDRRLPARVCALHTPALGPKAGPVEQYYLHVAVDGLRPGTTYFYAVGHDGFDPASSPALGAIGSFTTAPPAGARTRFCFTAFGDQGVGPHAVANDSLVLAQDPAFHLHAGDICYADTSGYGATSDAYDPRTWDVFFTQTEPVASRVPWMVTTGNHDMEAWYSPNGYGGDQARFTFPDSGPLPALAPGAYSFRYGNVAVVALDANDVSYEIPANLGYTGGRQTAWLDRELARLRALEDIDFVVVFFHHCAYSTTRDHASDGGVREHWVPLFDRYRVDLVVNGHNHVYERTDAVRSNAVTARVPVGATVRPQTDGTVYVTAGGGGRGLYGFPAPSHHAGHGRPTEQVATYRWTETGERDAEVVEWSRVRYPGYSFLKVEAVPAPRGATTRLEVSAFTDTGALVDRFTLARVAR